MDTRVKEQSDIDAKLEQIKLRMPMTYAAIKDKASVIGSAAYRFVRSGVAGQPNRFYAVEAGRVVGTPFDLPGVSDEVARIVVQFGVSFLIMWAPEAQQLLDPSADGNRNTAPPSTTTPPIGTSAAASPRGNSAPTISPVAGVDQSPFCSPKVGV